MEDDYTFIPHVSDEEIKKEKAKARQLRNTRWWRQKKNSGICHYCRKKFPPNDLTMDHLIPLIRGGRSIKSNLVPSCKECNNRKKHMLPTEWEELGIRD